MNYIQHLNSVCRRFAADPELNPSHVSLYLALFQCWNISRFSEVIFVNREEVMKMAKVGSVGTYHRCLKELHTRKYIIYLPSHNPYKSSRVKFLIFETTTETSSGTSSEQVVKQALIPLINNSKHKKQTIKTNIILEKEVIEFFKQGNKDPVEARRFLDYYETRGWRTLKGELIRDWKTVAEKWIARSSHKMVGSPSRNNLKTTKRKNYGRPL